MPSTPAATATIERIPRERALKAIHWLGKKLFPEGAPMHVGVVGSLRRWLPDVHDVDLIAPIPPESEDDAFYEAARTLFGDPKAAAKSPLFGAVAAPALDYGRIVEGLAPRFKKLTLELELAGRVGDANPAWAQPFRLKVEIHRYVDGPEGNRGWIEMIRTGPGGKGDEIGFGEMMLWRWKQRNPGGKSDKGFPVDGTGRRVPVPTEEEAFRLVGLVWVPPEHRTLTLAKQLAGSQRRFDQ